MMPQRENQGKKIFCRVMKRDKQEEDPLRRNDWGGRSRMRK